MKRRHHRWGTALILGISVSAFQTLGHPQVATAAPDNIFPAGSTPNGYKLGVLAVACWMGGVWSDAEHLPPSEWRARDDQRCRDLVISIYGHFDQARYNQIRENQTDAVGDLLAKIRATEAAATRDRTVTLFRDVAAAMHEGMLGRRAADRVKIDYDADAVEAKLNGDQRTASKALERHKDLERLLVGTDSNGDRQVFGLLLALDRMEMASGLPKQLKFYAVGHVLTTVFDVAPPPATLHPNAAPPQGTWLAYLRDVAARAGYPAVGSLALSHKSQETLAWTGVGHGFADHLRRSSKALPPAAVPELSRLADAVATRLESERATAEQITMPHATQETK